MRVLWRFISRVAHMFDGKETTQVNNSQLFGIYLNQTNGHKTYNYDQTTRQRSKGRHQSTRASE